MKTKNTDQTHVLNYKTNDELIIEGYQLSKVKLNLIRVFIIISVGLLKLFFYWRPDLLLKLTHNKCSLIEATKVLLKDKYNQYYVETVEVIDNLDPKLCVSPYNELHLETETDKLIKKFRFFTNKKSKYFWNFDENCFIRLKGLEEDYPLDFFRTQPFLTTEKVDEKILIYGINSIRVSLTSIKNLFFQQVLSPFYIFQIFSVTLWMFESYYLFAACIFIISMTSIIYSLYSIRRNERALRNMIHMSTELNVFRIKIGNKCEEKINSELLVPGDIIEIESSQIMQCDAVLLCGNVIVNESMLTGESIPITKTGIGYHLDLDEKKKLDLKEHKKNILYSGTHVIQTRYYQNEKTKAIVLRTGFNTSKGELIRTILYPKPSEFRFNSDLYKYIAALGFISLLGMIFTITIKLLKNNPIIDIIVKSLDLVSIVVPPSLQGALTACLLYAQSRLKKQKIFCVNHNTINVCGSIDTFVFDKTGTLTEDDSDLKCVVPYYNFGDEIEKIQDLENDLHYLKIIELMAACNSITFINGKIDGDPLDLKLFNFTKWNLIEPGVNETNNFDNLAPTIVRPLKVTESFSELGIIKQFPFLSSLQRMGVVCKSLNRKNFEFFCKGSPEIIASMCLKETLPNNFSSILAKYTRKGYRVIAMGYKILDDSYNLVKIEKYEREHFENDLIFLGLVIMENKLKPETIDVMKSLNAANIKTIMCTGDNLLTGISVSRDCQILSEKNKVIIIHARKGKSLSYVHSDLDFDVPIDDLKIYPNLSDINFAIDGQSFEVVRNNYPELFQVLIKNGSVYARMGPDQKQQLIEALQYQNKFVGMCGDGANDCGALKAAHAGVSLSNAESSIASPFTSKNPNIECVPILIKEGRATLITSFGIVKFICMYSLTQFISVILLYTDQKTLADMQFLYIDMVLITFIAFFFSRNKPFQHLDKKAPSNKLIAFRPIGSLIFHTIFLFMIQCFIMVYVQQQPWYEVTESQTIASYEVTSVFLVSTFQYLTEAIIFSNGLPYRRSIFSNKISLIKNSRRYRKLLTITLMEGDWKSQLVSIRVIGKSLR
ncbi:unnamed protein product [Brachionus calyciflorus]|uniref:Cation-transporting ATPase n=1 Tax=Brachionus calyciflorus TaxID=104777 RepID=A0A813UAI8_9BILA|nr:unnamed protein product [Brachionus calyciflorus]